MHIKKLILALFIASLCISAGVAIFIFLFGHFGEIEAKILFTTLALGGFSLTTLCSAILYEKGQYPSFAALGVAIAITGFLYTTTQIWVWRLNIFSSDNAWKWIWFFVVLTISFAHSSLLLLKRPTKKIQIACLSATIIFIGIVAGMLIYLVLRNQSYEIGEFFYRLLGTFAVLDVLGTIITPITYKFLD